MVRYLIYVHDETPTRFCVAKMGGHRHTTRGDVTYCLTIMTTKPWTEVST